jgi:hypothetical protein
MAILSGSRKSNILPTIYTEGNSDCGEEEISKPEIQKTQPKAFKQYEIALRTTGNLLDIGREVIKPLREKDSTVRRVSIIKDNLREYNIFIEDEKMKSRFSGYHDTYDYKIGYDWSGRIILEGCNLNVDDINKVMENLKIELLREEKLKREWKKTGKLLKSVEKKEDEEKSEFKDVRIEYYKTEEFKQT